MKGKNPIPNKEYILTIDHHHYFSISKYKIIPKGTVCINVEREIKEDGRYNGYNFTVKSTGLIGHTYYDWLLAENTISNRNILKKIDKVESDMDSLQDKKECLLHKLVTLKRRGNYKKRNKKEIGDSIP